MLEYFARLYQKSKTSFYEVIDEHLNKKKKMFIITANPETFTYGEKKTEFGKMLLDSKTTLVPDGIGLVKAAHMLNYPVTERIPGIDIVNHLLDVCNKGHYKIALLGAKNEVITEFVKVIQKDYPHIQIGTWMDGYIPNKDVFFEKIKKEKPDVCLVALGIPLQEELIYKHLAHFNQGIFIGVGGSFDVLSGLKKRAPKIFQKLNLEWLYRITTEPKRLKRFYNNNIKFIFKIKKLKKMRKK